MQGANPGSTPTPKNKHWVMHVNCSRGQILDPLKKHWVMYVNCSWGHISDRVLINYNILSFLDLLTSFSPELEWDEAAWSIEPPPSVHQSKRTLSFASVPDDAAFTLYRHMQTWKQF